MPLSRSIASLSSVAPSPLPISLFGVVLGIDGPRPIQLKAGGSTVLCGVHLADSTRPTGLELRLWGGDALSATSLRPMDVVRAGGVVACQDARFARTIYVKFRADSMLTRVSEDDDEGDAVKELFRWRSKEFGPLVKLARKGKLRSREWTKPPPQAPLRTGMRRQTDSARQQPEGGEAAKTGEVVALRDVGKLGRGALAMVMDVVVRGVRLRATVAGDDAAAALRSIVNRVCEGCGARRRAGRGDEGRCGACGGAPGQGWKWMFGDVYVVLGSREGEGEERGGAVAVASGTAVERLLLGVSAEDVWGEAGERAVGTLGALTRDCGPFRAAVRGGGDEAGVADVRLERLFVDGN